MAVPKDDFLAARCAGEAGPILNASRNTVGAFERRSIIPAQIRRRSRPMQISSNLCKRSAPRNPRKNGISEGIHVPGKPGKVIRSSRIFLIRSGWADESRYTSRCSTLQVVPCRGRFPRSSDARQDCRDGPFQTNISSPLPHLSGGSVCKPGFGSADESLCRCSLTGICYRFIAGRDEAAAAQPVHP